MKYIDSDGNWTAKMKIAVDNAISLNKTYTHGTWNNETKRAEGAWDCDVFVEAIVNTKNSGAVLPKSWKDAAATTVATHINQMEKDLKSKPEKGTNIVFHGGNHAMLLSLNDDGSVDYVHISSSNKDKKAFSNHLDSLDKFISHWSKQGNGELFFVPLNDGDNEEFSNTKNNDINSIDLGVGK